MNRAFPIFDSPLPLAIAMLVVTLVAVVVWRRPIAFRRGSLLLALVGMVLLATAAGGPNWPRQVAKEVAVVVDCSASTRGASYRNRSYLEGRIKSLLGSTPYRIYRFADGPAVAEDGAAASVSMFADEPSERTRYLPPSADAVLLFSDGRFALPASSPKTFSVVDPGLSSAVDSSIEKLEVDGATAAATVDVSGASRSLAWTGTAPPGEQAVSAGRLVLRRSADRSLRAISASLSPGDLWPENDSLSIGQPVESDTSQWFVSNARQGPPGFRTLRPQELPADLSAYLSASTIVLDNLPADALSPSIRDRLSWYVREAGGGMVIVGGDKAFAAGGYVGTPLDALSPLASTPPRPATHWILLTDGSASMGVSADGKSGGVTAWQFATAALVRLLPAIPPADPIEIGSFADNLTWWSRGKPASLTLQSPLPPASILPNGLTNLRAAIVDAAKQHDPALPANLLLLTDTDADVGDVPELVGLLKSRQIRLHLLATGQNRGFADLKSVVEQTGGRLLRQQDAARWAESAGELLRGATETYVIGERALIDFSSELRSLAAIRATRWNRTWLKPRATELATTLRSGEKLAMSARWQIGEGQVAAAAFSADPGLINALSALVARAPADPRFGIAVEQGPTLRIRVDAVDVSLSTGSAYRNGLTVTSELTPDGSPSQSASIPQTAPGRYEVELSPPGRPAILTVRVAGQLAARVAVAGRYPPEFDQIGLDRPALERLSTTTGGRLIEPDDGKPIDFRWPREAIDLTPWFALAGAIFIAAALLIWKYS